jgi:hypothetical protein
MSKLFRGGTALAVLAAASIAPWAVGSGAAAGGVTRYASPTSLDTTGSCSQSSPCEIHHAVADAAAGDHVIVEPGDYHLSTPLQESASITLDGQADQAFPHLIGDPTLISPTLSVVGGTVSRLYVETAAPEGLALDLAGGTGTQLTLVASGGDHEGGAVQLESSAGGTVLQDSLARVVGTEGEVVELHNGTPGGSVAVVNVTAVGGSNTSALESKADAAVVKNSIFQGGSLDIHVSAGQLTASYSNFRPSLSDHYTDGGHNQATAPLFVDPVNGDFHELSTSPTVDAGAADPLTGSFDLDGLPRLSGPAPDIGAYEHQVPGPVTQKVGSTAAPAAGDPFTAFAYTGPRGTSLLPVPKAIPPVVPQAGHTIYAFALAGHALVKLPGTDRFVPLPSLTKLPVGTVIDARSAVVWLFSARDARGTPQDAFLYGSKVKIHQRADANPMTDIKLVGGDFSSCPGRGAHSASTATVARAHISSRHIVRRLWAMDHNGRFRTHGANSIATVRGTEWWVDDRCDGTYTKVLQGEVLVRDRRLHRKVLVTAHHHYVAYR